MEINPRIKEVLEEFGIAEEDGLSYLLSVYFDCRPSYVPLQLVHRINTTQLLRLDEEKQILWTFPLFVGAAVDDKYWAWLDEYREMFSDVNSKRAGDKRGLFKRMKRFFSEHPEVRKEDVINATRMYIGNLSSPEYIMMSHYFIYKGVGKAETSALETWVEKYNLTRETFDDGVKPRMH